MPLPRPRGPELAALIARAFNRYPPFRDFIHAHLNGAAYDDALQRSFDYYVELAYVGGNPVLGGFDGDRLVGGMLIRTPASTPWGVPEDELTAAYARTLDAASFARLEAFEATMNDNAPQIDSGCYYVDTIAVDPDIQSKGYGRQMLEYVVELSRTDPASSAVCLSTEAPANHGLYERLGFEKISARSIGPVTTTSFIRHTD